jgi:hypothetical protein
MRNSPEKRVQKKHPALAIERIDQGLHAPRPKM